MKKIIIWHLYDNLMNLYGDWGNIAALSECLRQNSLDVDIKFMKKDDEWDTSESPAFIFIGAGTNNSMYAAFDDLKRRNIDFKPLIENGAILLTCGNSCELFGCEIIKENGDTVEALNISEYRGNDQKPYRNRDVVASSPLLSKEIAGFINQTGIVTDVSSPAFTIINKDKTTENEGIYLSLGKGELWGTYITGPVMALNPPLLEYIAMKICTNAGTDYTAWNEPNAYKAHEVSLNELKNN